MLIVYCHLETERRPQNGNRPVISLAERSESLQEIITWLMRPLCTLHYEVVMHYDDNMFLCAPPMATERVKGGREGGSYRIFFILSPFPPFTNNDLSLLR